MYSTTVYGETIVDLSEDWIEDCNHHHGRLLTGKFAHWCPDFDYLAIDETVDEFQYCQCEWES